MLAHWLTSKSSDHRSVTTVQTEWQQVFHPSPQLQAVQCLLCSASQETQMMLWVIPSPNVAVSYPEAYLIILSGWVSTNWYHEIVGTQCMLFISHSIFTDFSIGTYCICVWYIPVLCLPVQWSELRLSIADMFKCQGITFSCWIHGMLISLSISSKQMWFLLMQWLLDCRIVINPRMEQNLW